MNEREILEQASEIRDRQQRDAFLNQICGGDARLRKRLDELLASLDQTSSADNGSMSDSGTVTTAMDSPKALKTCGTQPTSPPVG